MTSQLALLNLAPLALNVLLSSVSVIIKAVNARWSVHRALSFGAAMRVATPWLVEIILAEAHAILSLFRVLLQGKKCISSINCPFLLELN